MENNVNFQKKTFLHSRKHWTGSHLSLSLSHASQSLIDMPSLDGSVLASEWTFFIACILEFST